jgi:hypothetical protein
MILSQDKSSSFVNISTFAHLVTKIIEALIVDIDIKAKGYKKPIIGTVFLLNNYHYMVKNLKNSQLMESVELLLVQNLEKLISKQLDAYRAK